MRKAASCASVSCRASWRPTPKSLLDAADDNLDPLRRLEGLHGQREARRPRRPGARRRRARHGRVGYRRQDRGQAAVAGAVRALQRRQLRRDAYSSIRRRLLLPWQGARRPAGPRCAATGTRATSSQDEDRRRRSRHRSEAHRRRDRGCRRRRQRRRRCQRPVRPRHLARLRQAIEPSGCSGTRSRAILSTTSSMPCWRA